MFVGTYSATKIEADDKYKLLGGNDGTVIANNSYELCKKMDRS